LLKEKIPEGDLLLKIPEALDYRVVYDKDLKKLGNDIKYEMDKSDEITGKFDRVAYFVELDDQQGNTNYVFVSFKAMTDKIKKIGIPWHRRNIRFQVKVDDMNVVSNVEGVKNGTGMDGGNIEFWKTDYGPKNKKGISGADDGRFDFGDEQFVGRGGFGSMQVHNYKERHTVFALNNWKAGQNANLGIGNCPDKGKHADWTHHGTAHRYPKARMRILVRSAR